MRCIWCREENNDQAVEHIFPEALGCPEVFKLAGGLVCRRCNNGLAHLDQAVIGDFDIPIFIANVPRKKGRPPVVNTRGNLVAEYRASGPAYSINMEKFSVKSETGANLGAFGKSERNVEASFTRDGPSAEIKFTTTIGQNPRFVRGIVKIGFTSLAFYLGAELAYSTMFDSVREFVVTGKGKRPILLMASKDLRFRNEAWPPRQSPAGYFAAVFRIFAIEFVVDLSPDNSMSRVLKENALATLGTSGWTQLPLDDAGLTENPVA